MTSYSKDDISSIRHSTHPRHLGFTLVELLVAISIIAVLMAFLLPTLSKSRTAALRVQCGSGLRQVGFGTLTYANDFAGNFPRSGGGYSPWAYMNTISDGKYLCFNYLNNDARLFHCPVNRPKYDSPTWTTATKTNPFAFDQIGYIYVCGEGQPINDPQRTGGGYPYHGWNDEMSAWADRAGTNIPKTAPAASRRENVRIMPTFSLKEAERYQNANQRPMFIDIIYSSALGGNNTNRSYPGPAHGDIRGDYVRPFDANFVFVDGHVENIYDPRKTRIIRGDYLYF